MPTGSVVLFYHVVQHSCLGNKKYLYEDRTVAVEDQHMRPFFLSFLPIILSCCCTGATCFGTWREMDW